MRYQVPQFIEVEDKIFGPLTIKQFLYVVGGVAIGFIIWNILPKFIAFIVGAPIVVFFLALAFYKYNDRPLILTVEGAMKYFFSNKLYIWNKKQKEIKAKKEGDTSTTPKLDLPKLSDSKLKELSWGLDVNENIK
jgi:hypothetical protein